MRVIFVAALLVVSASAILPRCTITSCKTTKPDFDYETLKPCDPMTNVFEAVDADCCPTCLPAFKPDCEAPTVKCEGEVVTRDDKGCRTCMISRECALPTTACAADAKKYDDAGCMLCIPVPKECPKPTKPCTDVELIDFIVDGCRTCVIEPNVCTPPTEICEMGAFARDANFCPTCKPAYECPRVTRTCDADEPARDPATKCYQCKPDFQINCPMPDECAADVKPVRNDDGCPTCRPAVTVCAERNTMCDAAPTCEDGKYPTRGDDCCPTCKFAPLDNVCSMEAREECKRKMMADDFPECDAFAAAVNNFDRATCCPACKPKAMMLAPVAARCTREEFKACIKDARSCEDQEPAFMADKSCCRTCARPERRCNLEMVAKCAANREPCKDGEKPTHFAAECCGSCSRPKPAACDACTDAQVCRRGDDGEATCVAGIVRKFKMKVAVVKRRMEIRELKKKGMKKLITEMIARYCEDPEHEEKCAMVKDRLADAIEVIKFEPRPDKEDEDDVEIKIDPPKELAQRRLLADEADILTDILNSEGGSDIIFNEDMAPVDSSASAMSSAGAVGTVIAMAVLAQLL